MKQPESKKKNMVTAAVLIGTILSGMIGLSKRSVTTIVNATDFANLYSINPYVDSGATLIGVIMFAAPLLVIAGIVFTVVRLLIKSAQRQKWVADRAAAAQRAVPQAAAQTYRTDSNVQPVELRDGEWVLAAPTQTILQLSEEQEDTYSGSMGYAVDTTPLGEGAQISAEHQEGHEHTPDHMQTDLTVLRPSEYSTIRGRRAHMQKNARLLTAESLSDEVLWESESMRTAVVYAEIIGPPHALEPHFPKKPSVQSQIAHKPYAPRINR